MWKFLRLRPPSFPTLRISQFASLIHHRFHLAERILGTTSMVEMEQIFRTGASEYWTTHYLFGKSSPPKPKFQGEQFIATLIMNVVVPFLHALDKKGKVHASYFGEYDKRKSREDEHFHYLTNAGGAWKTTSLKPKIIITTDFHAIAVR